MMTPPNRAPLRSQLLAGQYRRFLEDPDAVDPGWREVFDQLDDGARAWLKELQGPAGGSAPSPEASPGADGNRAAADSIAAIMLIRAYRMRGHLEAWLDPLGLHEREPHPELDPRTYGFEEADMDREVYLGGVLGLQAATPREIHKRLRRTYCRSVGIEFGHLMDPEEKSWIQTRFEGAQERATLKPELRRAVLEFLTAAETFERYCDKKFKGTKRFGLDGGESLMPALEMMIHRAAELKVEEIVIGMPHRGRLNVLANLMEKPLEAIFSEFQGESWMPEEILGAGDVKYHMGTSTDREVDGHPIHLSLTPNPSHLEAVNPVVLGRVRAKQDQRADQERRSVLGILMHGDAAFAGQGLVPETLQFCELPGYRVGGVIHVIVNNQIGFTTSPISARSSAYSSDVAKMIQAPIVHVNGDDPDAVVRAATAVVDYRNHFQKDAVIDIYCYRRFGHNESDEPAFTQPLMYSRIKGHPTTREIYAQRLIEDGIITQQEADSYVRECEARLDAGFEAVAGYESTRADWLEGSWRGLLPVSGFDARRGDTAADPEILREVGAGLVKVPDGFHINRKLTRQLGAKQKMFDGGAGIDWATAEALAFGTLLLEGHPVRLSGEDCNRGTFSHRHASWIDQQDETRHVPLNHLRDGQARLEVVDSPLSEFGVLGFEYGYAMAEPNALTLWEAQFGDFANGAQVITDQFLASGEEKWLRMNGLVMLLPHGFEGQGPEHSSARLERFLQLCAEDNLQVVNITTPANYFHALRRQIHRSFRKPLIVMSPKSLLRHKRAVSKLEDLALGSSFHRVLYCDELPSDAKDARQLVLCSGKVYYDLVEEREKRGVRDVHFLRLEQLYPFPADALAELLVPYKQCHLVWCQEEPRNMGAWLHVEDLIEEVAREVGCEHPVVSYAGRISSASPATGFVGDHKAEQARLLDEAFTIGLPRVGRIAARKALSLAREALANPQKDGQE